MVESWNLHAHIINPVNTFIQRGSLYKIGNFDPSWINRTELQIPLLSMIIDFDDSLSQMYGLLLRENFDPSWSNIRKAAKTFGSKGLPKIKELMAECEEGDSHRFLQFAHAMGRMMQRMEQGTLQFQDKNTSEKVLMWGTLFHAYGEFLAEEIGFKGVITSDEIVDLVTESYLITKGFNKDSFLYQAIVRSDMLDWVSDWDGFDPRFRKQILGWEAVPSYQKGRIVRRSDNFIVTMEDKFGQADKGGRFYMVPITAIGNRMLNSAVELHYFSKNTEQRTLNEGESSQTWLRMDLSQEVWDEAIAGDDYIKPNKKRHTIPPIQRMEDLIIQGYDEYFLPS